MLFELHSVRVALPLQAQAAVAAAPRAGVVSAGTYSSCQKQSGASAAADDSGLRCARMSISSYDG